MLIDRETSKRPYECRGSPYFHVTRRGEIGRPDTIERSGSEGAELSDNRAALRIKISEDDFGFLS